jgi:hypothetical protein
MLHFQKLDVYQRALEFLIAGNRIRGRFPKGNAGLADQLLGDGMLRTSMS